jgi:transcriptional regulator with GAF, ATPase, and Fis domain
MTLEGLTRGLGMDRAVFMLLNETRTKLTCKSGLGKQVDELKQQLIIDLTSNQVFKNAVEQRQSLFLKKSNEDNISKQIRAMLEGSSYLLMPVVVKNKVIGLLMADRSSSKRDISQQEFIAFQQFCQQTNMGISFLAIQG